jgi:hypothetical protein
VAKREESKTDGLEQKALDKRRLLRYPSFCEIAKTRRIVWTTFRAEVDPKRFRAFLESLHCKRGRVVTMRCIATWVEAAQMFGYGLNRFRRCLLVRSDEVFVAMQFTHILAHLQ